MLAVASLATAQQVPQPMVRLGDFIEVGNDVFMHIMAAADIRYKTTENWDFEAKVRDRTCRPVPESIQRTQEGEGDLSYAELRLGVEARYQKNLTLYLLFEHQQIFDGNLIDDRSNSTNPGGTSVWHGAFHGKPGLPHRALLDRLQVRGHALAPARGRGPVDPGSGRAGGR